MADVVWASKERLETIRNETECSIAPEICIEILSESNTEQEMAEKKLLYFSRGTEEFWLCGEDGAIEFFDKDGPLEHSSIIPDFPKKIDL